jgi:transcriptional regulator with XRE-family HTH domain
MGRSRGTRGVGPFGAGDPARSAFADRVRTIMQDRGLSVTETARRVRQYLPAGESISQASISHYRTGRALPRLRYLDALSLALGVPKSELISTWSEGPGSSPRKATDAAVEPTTPEAESTASPGGPAVRSEGCVHFVDLGDRMRLRIDQVLPWSTGLQILQILRGSGAGPERDSRSRREGAVEQDRQGSGPHENVT